MSILIKGMKMPYSCYDCPLTNDGFYLCKGVKPYKQLENECEERKPDWCPLIEVPPHGDLIDRDVLKENGELVNEDMGLYSYQGIAMVSINSARAVIEAEE